MPNGAMQRSRESVVHAAWAHRMGIDKTSVIIDDNSMKDAASVSQQVKRRRQELGWSLSELARRVGTSPATLSRYESGWTRFETYTLRKLATALGCELRIELRPYARPRPTRLRRGAAVKRLARLFWDHPLTADDLDAHPLWVLERVLDYGHLEDVRLLQALLGKRPFLELTARARRVSPRTAGFWKQILKREGIPCTKKYSRHTAWNY